MKKCISLVLALLMALALCSVSWADTTTAKYPDGVTDASFESGKSIYWTCGDQIGYASTLRDAVETASSAAGGAIVLYCKANEVITKSGAHVDVTKDITIYANGADFGGNDLSIGTYKAPAKNPTTVNIYNAKNLVVWGQPVDQRADVWNVNFYDCQNTGSNFLMYRGGEDGKATLNLTMTNCVADGFADSTIHATADGTITLKNCEFKNNPAPVNIAHKQAGSMVVEIEDCSFASCGTTSTTNTLNQYAAPIRFVNNGGGSLTTTVDNVTFTGTVGNNGDILVGDGRTGKTSAAVTATVTNTNANVQAQKPGYYKENGESDVDKVTKAEVKSSEKLTVKPVAEGDGKVTLEKETVPSSSNNNYYYYSPSTTTTDTTKGSPKTFDAGMGIYAVTAVLSVTGMAWVGKKRH